MISIHGLTKRQHKLAQLLWSARDLEHYHMLIQGLAGKDRTDAAAITEIMIQEDLWENLDEDWESREVCSDLIDRVRSS